MLTVHDLRFTFWALSFASWSNFLPIKLEGGGKEPIRMRVQTSKWRLLMFKFWRTLYFINWLFVSCRTFEYATGSMVAGRMDAETPQGQGQVGGAEEEMTGRFEDIEIKGMAKLNWDLVPVMCTFTIGKYLFPLIPSNS